MRLQRHPLIIRSILISGLGAALMASLCVLRPPWPSVGANIGAEDGPGSGRNPAASTVTNPAASTVTSESESANANAGATGNEDGPFDLVEDQERRVAESVERARGSVVALEYTPADGPSDVRRGATGVVIGDAGEVLSIRIDPPPGAAPVVARDAWGRRHPVQWVAADAETGLTLLRIKPGVAPPIRPAVHEPWPGGQVIVIGNPFGLGHSVLRGYVSGLNRRLELGSKPLGGLIQVAVALHPGDSGALVANLRGEWLGLVRSGLASPAQRQARERGREHDHDLGFAIPADVALWVADQLRAHGRVDRAYLGVRIDPGATADPPGASLLGVLDDSPASQGGLEPGDRIVALNGQPIHSPADLTDRLDRTLAGTEATLELARGQAREHRIIRTVSRPPAPSPPPKAKADPPPDPAPTKPKADDLGLSLPREVLERIERLERRLDELDRRDKDKARP